MDCYICLAGSPDDLSYPCKCPHAVHAACLARWQLQRVGTDDEKRCRFCRTTLPDWRRTLGPAPDGGTVRITVTFDGTTHSICLPPDAGVDAFETAVRSLFEFPEDTGLGITFRVPVPGASATAEELCVKGAANFEAVMHCAGVAAAGRRAAARRRQSGGI
jgi:hypothetical protein